MYTRVFITELPNNSIHKHFWMMSEADQSRKKGGSFQTWLDEIFQKNPIVFSAPKWMTFNDGRNMTNDPNTLVSTQCFGGTMCELRTRITRLILCDIDHLVWTMNSLNTLFFTHLLVILLHTNDICIWFNFLSV